MEAVVKPQIKVEKLEGLDDPTLEAGSVRTATATLINPTAKEFTYTTQLYFDVTKVVYTVVSSPFTLAPGASIGLDYTLTMPLVEDEYEVFIDAFCADAITTENPTGLIAHYKATENVVIVISPAIVIEEPIWA